MSKKLLHTNYSFFVCFIVFINCSTFLNAQELIPFEKVYPGESDPSIVRGDMKIIGNSILGIQDDNFFGEGPFEANDDYNGDRINNRAPRAYIDIDSDSSFNSVFNTALPLSERQYTDPLFLNPEDAVNNFGSPVNAPISTTTGTFSSSTAELLIDNESNTTDKICSRVIKAYLYWGAIYPAESQNLSSRGLDEITLDRPDCTDCEHYTDVKILPPGAIEYIDIKASNSGIDHNSLKSRVIFDGAPTETKDSPYVCTADVTSLFSHLQNEDAFIQGNWTVANVRATTGSRRDGSGGGWSLAIIYENPLSNVQKNITFFEGFVNIEGGQEDVNFTIEGFETTSNGPVNTDIATIGLEGDIGISGDQFQINNPNNDGSISDDWIPLSYLGSETNNFYDSSIYSKGNVTRYPNSSNTLGYDSDHFQIVNGPNGNDYITNSDTSADFRLTTFRDSFLNFFNAFAIEVDSSELEELSCINEIEETPVYIPDPILKALLVNDSEINTNGDTEIQVSEAESYTGNLLIGYSIDYSDPFYFLTEYTDLIENLEGIEAFTNITGLEFDIIDYEGYFDFSNNTELTELILGQDNFSDIDVSKNIKLTSLDAGDSDLTRLDVTNLSELEYLDLRKADFSSIDLSKNLKLKELELFASNISSLDLSNNIALETLSSVGSPLRAIDITNNPNIIDLSIGYTNSTFTTIDLSNNLKLEDLYLTNVQVTELDLSNNLQLENLSLTSIQVTELDLSKNINLTSFSDRDNLYETLDLSKNINLKSFTSRDDKNLSYLNLANGNNQNLSLRINDNTNLTTLCVDDVDYAITNFVNIDDSNVFSNCVNETVVYIPDPNLKALLVNNSEINTNGDTEIQFSEAESFTGYLDATYVVVTDYESYDPFVDSFKNAISDLTGFEAFKNITGFDFSNNRYDGSFDFSNNSELTELNLTANYFSDIDISKNFKLTFLIVSSSTIGELDITHLSELEILDIRLTEFPTIDLSQNLKLKELSLSGSKISSIDLSDKIYLEKLSVGSAPLEELDITNNINITFLSFGSSIFNSIDLSNNTKLEFLYCSDTLLTELDLSNNINLKTFIGGGNLFETIDLSKAINLESFINFGDDKDDNLSYINVANGNNENLHFSANNSPNLITVCVDDVDYAITNFTNIDDSNVFSTCVDEVTENTCDNIQTWTPNNVYSETGTQVVYNNKIYENKWYTKNQNPEEYSEFSWSLWTLVGECDSVAKSLINNDFGITVYPNTFTNSINVSIDNTNQVIDTLQLVDLSGNIIISEQENNTLNNLEAIAGGMYLLQVVDSNGEIIATQKVIKN